MAYNLNGEIKPKSDVNKNFSDTIIISVGNEKPKGFMDNENIYCKESTN